jgi:hypothetical protein
MSKSTIRRMCKDCGQHRPFSKDRCNHILHLILSVITIGFWTPVWLLLGIINLCKPFRCESCGKGSI